MFAEMKEKYKNRWKIDECLFVHYCMNNENNNNESLVFGAQGSKL